MQVTSNCTVGKARTNVMRDCFIAMCENTCHVVGRSGPLATFTPHGVCKSAGWKPGEDGGCESLCVAPLIVVVWCGTLPRHIVCEHVVCRSRDGGDPHIVS